MATFKLTGKPDNSKSYEQYYVMEAKKLDNSFDPLYDDNSFPFHIDKRMRSIYKLAEKLSDEEIVLLQKFKDYLNPKK